MTLSPSPFDTALVFVLAREDGYSNRPGDRGGPTNMGITQATYDSFRGAGRIRSVRDLTPDEARAIYWSNYWIPAKCDIFAEVKPNLALVVFDCAVNQGSGESTLILQRALELTADGILGKQTLGAIATCDEAQTVTAFLVERARIYRQTVVAHPTDAQFLTSEWLPRLRWCARATNTPIAPAFAFEQT